MSTLEQLPVFFSERQVADISSFSPSAGKPAKVVASWAQLGIPLRVIEPVPVTIDQLALAHERDFVEDTLAGRRPNGFGSKSPAVAASLPWTSGSLLSAAREALRNRQVAVAPCSGFHHAGYAHSGGFCTFNGLMVTATTLLDEGAVGRIGILDCDHHYGDGTQNIIDVLGLKDRVQHFSAGREYCLAKQAEAFLARLPGVVKAFAGCDLLLYQAGADPHVNDLLGGWLTERQLAERDRIVFATARRIGLPVAWDLAGGYQYDLRQVLDLHDNTLIECAEAYGIGTEERGEIRSQLCRRQ